MSPFFLAAALLASSPEDEANPRVPTVTSSARYERKPKMVVLFRRYEAFFPAYCVAGGKVRAGDGCLAFMPRRPTVRLMDGRRLELQPLAKHGVSAWNGPDKKGWALPESDAGPEERETELAVWPPDANPGLEPLPATTVPVDLEGLRKTPAAERLPPLPKPGRQEPEWPPVVHQTVPLGKRGTAVVVSGVRRGLYLAAPAGWRALRTESAAEVGTTIVGRADLDGDGRAEWIVHILGWNEFGLEVRPDDFGKPLFEFNDCGV
ncbi:MAG: hypothetical protein AMXMBFR34_21060 [Myxococcaceae bacterium]